LTKINILTDFVHGNAIFKLPKIYVKKLSKFCNIYNVNQKNIPNDRIEVYWGTRITDEDLKKFINLKWIHFGSVGTDKLSYTSVKNKKMFITNSKNLNSLSVSELIMEYFLDTKKKLLFLKNFSNRKQYEKHFQINNIKEIEKILILGYGNITKKLEKHLKYNNVQIDIYSSRSGYLNKKNLISFEMCKKKIKNYSTIINLLPNNKKNKKIINFNFLNNLKKNINLILVGRVETINLTDLYKFLLKRKDCSVYLDGIIDYKYLKQFKKIKNIYISPHIGGYYANYWHDQFNSFEKNLNRFKNRTSLKNLVKINEQNFK
jgi:phosphoglycerate dehydrogenase-like enzyme